MKVLDTSGRVIMGCYIYTKKVIIVYCTKLPEKLNTSRWKIPIIICVMYKVAIKKNIENLKTINGIKIHGHIK